MDLLTDYLFVQDLIKARLSSELGKELPVHGIEELAQVTEANITRDTLFVLWDGERVADTAGNATRTMLTHRYTVFLAVKNARQTKDARNESAGPMLSRVHKALAGWAPVAGARPLVRTNGRQPNYRASVALYPLTFAITLTL